MFRKKNTTKQNVANALPWLAALSVFFVVTGCATIMSGTKQKISIKSSPSNAKITISQLTTDTENTIWEGTTPATVKLKRKNSYVVRISREGFEPVEVPVEYKSMNGWLWGNVVYIGWSIITIPVDFATGASNVLGPDDINIELVEVRTSDISIPETYAVIRSMNEKGETKAHAFAIAATETERREN